VRAQLWSASIRGLTVGGLGRDREKERGRAMRAIMILVLDP